MAAFWALFAVFRVADQVVTAPDLRTVAHWLVPSTAESLGWIVLTPAVFAVVAWAVRRPGPLLAHVALYVALGAACALAAGAVGLAIRTPRLARLTPPGPASPSPESPPSGAPRRPGPPFWVLYGNAAALYVAVLAAALARETALRARSEREQAAVLEAQLAGARLDALRRQLDPHFLFNAHAVVASLIDHDPPGARHMLAQLSEFLRASLRDAGGYEVSLAEELALVDLYLDIMRVRYAGRLEVETHVDPATRDALVPSLVLQPLVENAVKHGVERRRGRGRLVLEAARDGDALVLRVRDGGVDDAGSVADRPPSAHDGAGTGMAGAPSPDAGYGIGLSNTAARLAQLYGPAARVALAPAPGGGTEVTVRLPFHTVPVSTTPGPRPRADGARAGPAAGFDRRDERTVGVG